MPVAQKSFSTHIREITPGDASAAAELSAQLGYPASAEALKTRIESLRGQPDQVVYVACRLASDNAEQVVGWIDVGIARHLAADPRAEIAGLVVDSTVRSQGVGRQLVERAEQWARDRGLTTMLVRSRSTREAAHRFYLRDGYTHSKTSVVFTKDL